MGVAGVVVAGVEPAEHLPGEVGDVLRVAAADIRVCQAGKQRPADRAVDGGPGRREGALHLVEDDAPVSQPALRIGGVLELEADPLLLERVLAQAWKEGGVEVDVEEVLEVLLVAGAEEVGGPVRAGEGVHEGRERAAGHAEERVSDRVALRAGEDDVLEDVRNARGVVGRGREEDGETVVVVGAFDVDVSCAGSLVLELDVCAVQPGERLAAPDRVATDRAFGCQCHANFSV